MGSPYVKRLEEEIPTGEFSKRKAEQMDAALYELMDCVAKKKIPEALWACNELSFFIAQVIKNAPDKP